MLINKTLSATACVLLMLLTSGNYATAGKLEFTEPDKLGSLLKMVQGKVVEIQLTTGEKLAGTVQQVGSHSLLLARLKGRDFYDAYINIDNIAAFIISNQ